VLRGEWGAGGSAPRGAGPALRLTRLTVLALVALAGGACAAASPGGTSARSPEAAAQAGSAPPVQRLGGLSFQQSVTPFSVVDEHGEPYAFPFLGGMVAPRPQFVDVDGDGDLDLFVQEYTGALWFFENVGSATESRFVWRTNRFQDLQIGEWYRFVDIDGDGRVDLLTEEPYSYIRYYRNEGVGAQPRFEFADSLRDTAGRAIFMDRQNVPAIVDLDCNGRLDLFVGRVEGTVARYEAEAPGSHRFVFLTEFWEGIEIIGEFGPDQQNDDDAGAVRHGANALAFADFDGDGDLDLFWGDYFEPGMLLIENIGRTCSSPSFEVRPVPLPGAPSLRTSGYNAPAPADLNGNGRLDFAMGVLGGAFNPTRTAADNFYQWDRLEDGTFELRTRRFLSGIDVGSESAPTVVDLDGDGRLDLVVGSKIDPNSTDTGLLFFFRDEATSGPPRLRLADTLRLATAYNQAPAFGDLDGDGVLDLVMGTWSGEMLVFRGQRQGGGPGVPRFVQDTTLTLRLPRGSNATPILVDLDGDGTLDLLVGQANGMIAFYRNEGTPTEPRFALVTEQLDGIDVGRRSAPALVDLDGDGLLDLVVGREEGGLAVFRNEGSAGAPRFVEWPGFTLPLPPISAPVFWDVDGDGTIDLLAGTTSGGVVFYRGLRGR